MALSVGDVELWHSQIDFIVMGADATPPATSAAVSVVSVDLTPPGPVVAGSAAVFVVEFTVEQGWANLDVELTGDMGSGQGLRKKYYPPS